MTTSSDKHDLTTQAQKDLLVGILSSFDDANEMFAYMVHVGVPIRSIRTIHDLLPAWWGFYRIRPGLYDIDRACEDLRWWPPIAARIADLEAEAKAKQRQKSRRRLKRRR